MSPNPIALFITSFAFGVFASTLTLAQLSPVPYEKMPAKGDDVPMCYIHKCVSVGKAGDSVKKNRRRQRGPKPNSKSNSANGGFASSYEPKTGILGANIDLEREFQEFVDANRVFVSSFKIVHSSSADPSVSEGSFDYEIIKEKGRVNGKEAWSKIINSQNGYFDSIAFLAGAATDDQAQNAIAHATISAHLTIDLGETIAEKIGETKEIAFPGGDLDTAKDLLNNTAGREIAKEILANDGKVEDIPEAIAKAYKEGRLWIIKGGKISPSGT